jgi:two-component system cell cycle response regulator
VSGLQPRAAPGHNRAKSDPELVGSARGHEAIAAMLAADGQWRRAYEHLRVALDLHRAEAIKAQRAPVTVPEQLRHEVARLRREHAEAREESFRDSLTASYNRRYLSQRLVTPLAGLGVALVDLDWFKQINDTFGHVLGDRVLQRVVELLCAGLPNGAFCARYGGEEFVLVLPNTDSDTAVAIAEDARSRIERYPWDDLAPGLRVTISAGVAHDGPATGVADAEQKLLLADTLLYAAKQSGRNAVAYSSHGRVHLAGTAAARRGIVQPDDRSTIRSVHS